MPVICLLNQKGGVGKTTLALNLAASFALAGDSVLYVDADPQSTALDWSSIRQQPPLFNVVSIPRNTLHTQLPTLGAGYSWIFIDGPPLAGDVAKSAILASDLIIVPLQPSGADKWSTEKILTLIDEARFYKPNLNAAITVNRKAVGTAIGKGFRDGIVADYPAFTTFQTEIGQYVVFAEALTIGSTVAELDPKSIAAKQITALANEIKRVFSHAEENQRALTTAAS